MLFSPLQSRLAASLLASMIVLGLYLLLFLPRAALAADLQASTNAIYDSDHSYSRAVTLYEPDFELFDRGIIGRALPNVPPLLNNRIEKLNLKPGDTACYVVEKSMLFPGSDSSTIERGDHEHLNELRDVSSEEVSASTSARQRKRQTASLYLSANTCLQPYLSDSDGHHVEPPQLIMRFSESSDVGCPRSSEGLDDNQTHVFDQGAVMYQMEAHGDVFVSITAPNVSSIVGEETVWAFEVAASVDDYYFRYDQADAELLWMDSDSSSVLLITRNLTQNKDETDEVLNRGPPYQLFVENNNQSTIKGIAHSVCGLQTYAQISANRDNDGKLHTLVRTGMTTRGPGSLPKQQFYFEGLNSSSSYTGVLVKTANATDSTRRSDDNVLDGVVGGGGTVFEGTKFLTLSGTNCRVVTDLDFCDEIQYAVPGNDKNFNNTELAKAYDDHAKQIYANFEKVMMQIPCEADSTSRYSLIRDCDDCKEAYKRWLCTVSIPRCEDFTSTNSFALLRNANQSYPNGTKLSDQEMVKLFDMPYHQTSRNSFIDKTIQPGPYKEVLPCEDLCYDVVQSCPAVIGFNCPIPGMQGFNTSYGRRDNDGSTVSCNYPGEARTPMNAGVIRGPSVFLLSTCMLVFVAFWGL